MKGQYEKLVNGVYCYSIAFAMLHELSHFTLGHLEKDDEDIEDERDADICAIWSVFNDLEGREKFTAIVGVICLLFALLMINPTMEEDNIHPREDRRIMELYDSVKEDNPKYTFLLVHLFKLWAIMNEIKGFPEDVDSNEEGLSKIRDYLETFQ